MIFIVINMSGLYVTSLYGFAVLLDLLCENGYSMRDVLEGKQAQYSPIDLCLVKIIIIGWLSKLHINTIYSYRYICVCYVLLSLRKHCVCVPDCDNVALFLSTWKSCA